MIPRQWRPAVAEAVRRPVFLDPRWFKPGAVVPINAETVSLLLDAVKALAARADPTDEQIASIWASIDRSGASGRPIVLFARALRAMSEGAQASQI